MPLTHRLHSRGWLASGFLRWLQDSTGDQVSVLLPNHSVIAGLPPTLLPAAYSPEEWGRFSRVRTALRLATIVARERASVTYRHKLTQRGGTRRRLAIGVWRALRGLGHDVERVAVRMDSRLPPSRWLALLFDWSSPDLVLLPTMLHEDAYHNDIIRVARQHGVPVLAAPASWDTLTSKGGFLQRPDRLIVWGQRSAEHAVAHHGFTKEAVQVTGPPHFAFHDPKFERPSCLEPFGIGSALVRYAERLRVPRDQPLPILVAGTSLNYWADEHRMLADLGRALGSHRRVIYRPHPRGSWGWHLRDIMPPGVTLDPQVERAIGTDRAGYSLDPVDLAYYSLLLSYVQCVVAAFSTLVIEAAIQGRPSCLVGWGASRHGEGGVLRHADFEHMQHVVEWPGVALCRDFHTLLRGVEASDDVAALNWTALPERAREVAVTEQSWERIDQAIHAAA